MALLDYGRTAVSADRLPAFLYSRSVSSGIEYEPLPHGNLPGNRLKSEGAAGWQGAGVMRPERCPGPAGVSNCGLSRELTFRSQSVTLKWSLGLNKTREMDLLDIDQPRI